MYPLHHHRPKINMGEVEMDPDVDLTELANASEDYSGAGE